MENRGSGVVKVTQNNREKTKTGHVTACVPQYIIKYIYMYGIRKPRFISN